MQVHLVIRNLAGGKIKIVTACEDLRDALAMAGQSPLMYVQSMNVEPASRSRPGGGTPTSAITGSSTTAGS